MRIEERLRVCVAGGCAAVALASAPPASAESISQSFTTAGEHEFIVPPGVTGLQLTLIGGDGAAGIGGPPGGVGATVGATLSVTPGEQLYAEVAGDGTTPTLPEEFSRGGYGGGGTGGYRISFGESAGGGGGGGASDVRTCSVEACTSAASLESRLVVAAGGGGGGGAGHSNGSTPSGGIGGNAENSAGAGAQDSQGDAGGSGGKRATATAGGAAGEPSAECEASNKNGCPAIGALGEGGVGGASLGSETLGGGGGGGGGGGLFGGGGGGGGKGSSEDTGPSSFVIYNGGGGGGGGGASGVPAGVTSVSGYALSPTAEGATPLVKLTWTAPPPAVVTDAASAITSTTATLNGTVNPNAWQLTGCSFHISPAPAGIAAFPCTQQLGDGDAPVSVSATVAGLSPATAYTVTLTAASTQGSSSGAAVTFTTTGVPSIGKGIAIVSAPTVTGLTLSPTTFRRGEHAATLTKASAGKRNGAIAGATTISFSLSANATVTLSFEQAHAGTLVGHGCVAKKPNAHHKGRVCSFYKSSGTLPLGAHAGLDRVRFDGLLAASKQLPPGRYRLALSAANAGGKTSAAQHPTFQLLP